MLKKIVTALGMSRMLLASNSAIAEDATSKNDSLNLSVAFTQFKRT